jgi:hypothetical protein
VSKEQVSLDKIIKNIIYLFIFLESSKSGGGACA